MASAIGMRTKASSIIAASPTSASVIGSGGRLRGAPAARHENLEHVQAGGQRDHRHHEIDERPDEDTQDVGGVPILGNTRGLDPHLPGEKEEQPAHHGVHQPLQLEHRGRGQHAVDEVHGDVLIRMRHERQPGEDQHEQHELGDLKGAADRAVEKIACDDVDERQAHQGEKESGGGDAEDRIAPPLPATLGLGHPRSLTRLARYLRSAETFLISARNSSSAARASNLYFSLAFFTQSSMIGWERLRTSATKAGWACTILTFAFFSASMPFWSAASHDCPFERAAYS